MVQEIDIWAWAYIKLCIGGYCCILLCDDTLDELHKSMGVFYNWEK